MQKVSVAVTALAPRGYRLFLLGVTSILVVLAIGIVLRSTDKPSRLSAAGQSFEIDYATTDSERVKGLSGRQGIAADYVLLFDFQDPAERCFWMKDMNFAIDMIWVDANKKITAIESNVKPETYPTNFCHGNAVYVAEFAAGTANRLGLKPGDQLKF